MEKSKQKRQTHGLSKTRIYHIMEKMKDRCYNKNNKYYSYYGGRGITICDEWRYNFVSFYNWAMKNGYEKELTIDRIKSDSAYAATNCRWVTRTIQSRNTRLLRRSNKSGYRGVSFRKDTKKWTSEILVNYKKISLGSYKCRIEAAYAYDKYVIDNNLEHPTNIIVKK